MHAYRRIQFDTAAVSRIVSPRYEITCQLRKTRAWRVTFRRFPPKLQITQKATGPSLLPVSAPFLSCSRHMQGRRTPLRLPSHEYKEVEYLVIDSAAKPLTRLVRYLLRVQPSIIRAQREVPEVRGTITLRSYSKPCTVYTSDTPICTTVNVASRSQWPSVSLSPSLYYTVNSSPSSHVLG